MGCCNCSKCCGCCKCCECCGCCECCKGCLCCRCCKCTFGGECNFCKCCSLGVKFRPLGFILGLPFISVSLNFSLIGAIVLVVGKLLNCLCPCPCVKRLMEFALRLIKVPLLIMKWFTSCCVEEESHEIQETYEIQDT